MKDAMGELNMTVVTIVAIGAISAFFVAFLWPNIKNSITKGWNDIDSNTGGLDTDADNYPGYIIQDYFDIPNLYK